jgi:two-component system response regulator NreC
MNLPRHVRFNEARKVHGGRGRAQRTDDCDGASKAQKKAGRPLTSDAPERQIMTVKPYRVLVADDHAVVRHGLRVLLEAQPGVQVCGEASTGLEAVDYAKKQKPDLLVLDLTMPDMNGLEVMRAIRGESPSTDVLILTMHFSEELAREMLRCGGLGYVLKSDADTELLAAVDHIRHHQPFFTSRLAISMAQNYVRKPGDITGSGEGGGLPNSPLTPREIEVVKLLAEGKSNKEVASTLGVSTRTIESHRNHIMHKMNFASFSELVRFALRTNLVEP